MKVIIAKGETLSGISELTGMSIEEIMALNKHIKDPNKIKAGDELDLGPNMFDNLQAPVFADELAPPLLRKWKPDSREAIEGIERITWPKKNHRIWE